MAETFAFNADIQQLMSLITNTFYSNKEIFLRELVSDASDALDRIRYESITDPDKIEAQATFYIKIIPDRTNSTITFEESGIGMTEDELINNNGGAAKKRKTKRGKEVSQEREQLSKNKPLWKRGSEGVANEEYASFYMSLGNDRENHLAETRFSVEGRRGFRALHFVPRRAPFVLFGSKKKSNNIGVYEGRVFGKDDSGALLPERLDFVKDTVNPELTALAPSTMQIKGAPTPERKRFGRIGGFALPSMSTLQQMWIAPSS